MFKSLAFLTLFAVPFLLERVSVGSPVSVTLLHTNDLHSHFQPDRGPLRLGGVARLKTAIDQVREKEPHTLLVDGGDWSEGTLYYNESLGAASIRMLDELGYDFAVVGNHDWLNGPDVLLDSLKRSEPRTTFLSANLELDHYPRKAEFQNWVVPWAIREIEGIKIAFVGISTYEVVYDNYFSPVKINEPFLTIESVANQLKKQADVVIAVSHNSIEANEIILKFSPSIDVIVGAHDHKKLNQPKKVDRLGAQPGWIVEAGCWGQFLGKMDLKVSSKKVELVHYQLIQIDESITENTHIKMEVESLDTKFKGRFGTLLDQEVGTSDFELDRTGNQSDMANLAADAYLKASQADLAIENQNFIYDSIHQGVIRSADIFNSNPAIYNPKTQKSWTIHTVPLTGLALKWLLYAVYTTKAIGLKDLFSVAGVSYVYDPLFFESKQLKFNMGALTVNSDSISEESFPVVKDIKIQGQPLDTGKKYRIAMSGGMLEAIEFLNYQFPGAIPMQESKDTQIEAWRSIEDLVQVLSPLSPHKVPATHRAQTLQPDLALSSGSIQVKFTQTTPTGPSAEVSVTLKNCGVKVSDKGVVLHLLENQNGKDQTLEPNYTELGPAQAVSQISGGESQVFRWDVVLNPNSDLHEILARVEGTTSELNHANDQAQYWLRNPNSSEN